MLIPKKKATKSNMTNKHRSWRLGTAFVVFVLSVAPRVCGVLGMVSISGAQCGPWVPSSSISLGMNYKFSGPTQDPWGEGGRWGLVVCILTRTRVSTYKGLHQWFPKCLVELAKNIPVLHPKIYKNKTLRIGTYIQMISLIWEPLVYISVVQCPTQWAINFQIPIFLVR